MGKVTDRRGKIYIGSMNMRGKWAPRPAKTVVVNVTSAQGKASNNRRDFSPMTEKEGGYRGFNNFESFWQSGKVFDGVPEEKTKAFWKTVNKPMRRNPKTKGKQVLHASWPEHPNERMDYVVSRKQVYVPNYLAYMKDSEMTAYWNAQLDKGTDIVIMDFDGPRIPNENKDEQVTCVEVTEELLREKINDPAFPFGHGYVVAAHLAGIEPSQYII